MTQNWYAVYTKPHQEKKVASQLTKRGIDNYYPVNRVCRVNPNSKKITNEPLFSSFVFVHIVEDELVKLKKIQGVINFVYWRSKPAIIHDEEIDILQQFTSVYQNIKLEKSSVNMAGMVRLIDDPIISFKENAATIRFQTLKIMLPSIGFTMIAERDKVSEEPLQMVSRNGIFNKSVNSFLSN
ncbi:hypothetical protein BH11BAC3_BH11BAC3_18390 [soil metagenome]